MSKISKRPTKTITVIFKDKTRERYTRIASICIFPDVRYRGIAYDEPVLYFQRLKRIRKENRDKVEEIFIPLSKINTMM